MGPNLRSDNRMKLLLIYPNWLGRSGDYCHVAAKQLGHESSLMWGSDHEVLTIAGFLKDKARRLPFIASTYRKLEALILNKRIIEKVRLYSPDIVINNCPSLFSETIQEIKANSQCLVFWAGDNPELYPSLINTLHIYDYFFAGAPDWISDEIQFLLKNRAYYLPYGCSVDVFNKSTLPADSSKRYGAPLSFVGARYSDREIMLSKLLDFELAIWGWKRDNVLRRVYQFVRGRQRNPIDDRYGIGSYTYTPKLNSAIRGSYTNNITANMIYNASSIVLNLQHPQMITAVNSKTFEIAASGAFQLFYHTGDMLGLYDKDTEIVCFDTIDDLRDKIRFYLKYPDERRTIADRAYRRTLSEHTFAHRLRKMFDVIGG